MEGCQWPGRRGREASNFFGVPVFPSYHECMDQHVLCGFVGGALPVSGPHRRSCGMRSTTRNFKASRRSGGTAPPWPHRGARVLTGGVTYRWAHAKGLVNSPRIIHSATRWHSPSIPAATLAARRCCVSKAYYLAWIQIARAWMPGGRTCRRGGAPAPSDKISVNHAASDYRRGQNLAPGLYFKSSERSSKAQSR